MSIKEILEKIKPLYTLLLILIVSAIFFCLGRLSVSGRENSEIKIAYQNEALALAAETSISSSTPDKIATTTIKTDGPVIGSKSGKKYYFPWCGTVKRIKPENQVHFPSIAAAKAAGFTPGGNCKGLQ